MEGHGQADCDKVPSPRVEDEVVLWSSELWGESACCHELKTARESLQGQNA